MSRSPRPTVAWRKSSYSGPNGNCVEVAGLDRSTIGVRDSKDRSGPILAFDATEWAAFTASVSVDF